MFSGASWPPEIDRGCVSEVFVIKTTKLVFFTNVFRSTYHLEPIKNEIKRIIVNNLPPTVTEVGLRIIFQNFGEILQCLIVPNEEKLNSCHALIHFSDSKSSQESLQHDGSNLDGYKITVDLCDPKLA